jgi:hypothetical protein
VPRSAASSTTAATPVAPFPGAATRRSPAS